MELKVKKLHKNAVLPKYKTDGSVGMDFCSMEDVMIPPGSHAMIRTGISVELSEYTEMRMRQRSGLSLEYPNYLMIGVGTIDSDYRGEIMVPVINNTTNIWYIKKGEAIIQGVVGPYFRCNIIEEKELSKTERGEGGFGHTGK